MNSELKTSSLLVLLFVALSLSAPVTTPSTPNIPTFLKDLWDRIRNGQETLDPGVTVHGLFAVVKKSNLVPASRTTVELSANFSGQILSLNTRKSTLHLRLERSGISNTVPSQAVCKLNITDIKRRQVINSRVIQCNKSSDHIVNVTTILNEWLKQPSTNLGVQVKISTNVANVPDTSLPFINSSNNVEQPYYIMYEG